MRGGPLLLLAVLLLAPFAGALVPVPLPPGGRYGAGTFSATMEPYLPCYEPAGPAAMTYGFASTHWELRTYLAAVEPIVPDCALDTWVIDDVMAFREDIAPTGGVTPRWISSACGFANYVVHPFPSAGAFLLTMDYLPPAGCTHPEVHYRWEMTVS